MRNTVAVGALLLLLTVGGSQAQAQEQGGEDPASLTELVLMTLPAISGVVFTLDGESKTTDEDGVVRFFVPLLGGIFDRLTVDTPEVLVEPGIRAQFTRWRGHSDLIIAQFKFEYEVSFYMQDDSGRAIATDLIDEVTLKSSVGEVRTIDPSEPVWLLGTRIVPGRNALEERPVFWTVQSATDSGLEVVNRSETKFFPATETEILIPTLYFSARFEVLDAFFGFRTGEALLITSPNGHSERVPLVDGVVELEQVARGEYTVTVDGPGIDLSRPVAISRDLDVDLKLYSWLDIGLVVVLGLIFLTVPVWLGFSARRARRSRGRHIKNHPVFVPDRARV